MSGFKAGDRVKRVVGDGGAFAHDIPLDSVHVVSGVLPGGSITLRGQRDDSGWLPGYFELVECDATSCYCNDVHLCPYYLDGGDDISNPSHYNEGRTLEPWTVIDDWHLDYYLGSALKYLARAGRKDDEIKDLRKLIAFVERRIQVIRGGEA